jgi:hypothetical protein
MIAFLRRILLRAETRRRVADYERTLHEYREVWRTVSESQEELSEDARNILFDHAGKMKRAKARLHEVPK